MVYTVRHIGKMGDIVYSMAALRGWHATTNEKVRVILHWKGRTQNCNGLPMQTEGEAKQVAALLDTQSYIEDVQIEQGFLPKFTLDNADANFETWVRDRPCDRQNIALSACEFLKVDSRYAKATWLENSVSTNGCVLLNWTGRYPSRNPKKFWQELDQAGRLPSGLRFLGYSQEKSEFEQMLGREINGEAIEPENLKEAAELIAGCNEFLGGQSGFLAIAHGLQKKVTVEAAALCPDCIFLRPNADYPGIHEHIKSSWGI